MQEVINRSSLRLAPARLWRTNRKGEGDGALSTFLPWTLRNWMFHNYAAATVRLRRQQNAQVCGAFGGEGSGGRGQRLFVRRLRRRQNAQGGLGRGRAVRSVQGKECSWQDGAGR